MKKLLSYFFALFLVVLACSDDGEDPIVIPVPQNVIHKIVLEGNAGQGATAKLYLNGLKDSKTTNSDGSVTLTYSDKNSTTTFDSITVEKSGFTKWIIKSTLVGKEKSLTYSIEELFKETMIIGMDETSEFDYLVITKESPDYLLAKVSEKNPDQPDYVYYYNSHAKKWIGVFYKDGLIDKFIIDGYIFLLRNFDGNKVDLGVMDKDGEIIIVEGLETAVDWTSLAKSELNKSLGILGWLGSVSKTIDALPCIVAAKDFGEAILYANPAHLLLSMKSAFECGSDIGYSIGKNLAANGFRIEVSQDVIDNIDAFYDYFDLFSTTIDCGTLDISCIADLLGYANDEFKEKALEPLADANDQNGSGSNGQGRSQIQVVEQALISVNNGNLDSDGDGINNGEDDCPNSPRNSDVDRNGCTKDQLDSDGDGVENDEDECPNTPKNSDVDKNGCAVSQLDTDGDGVTDDKDSCPNTPKNTDVNKNGCALSQLDTDGDGVMDDKDKCSNSPSGVSVNEDGCTEKQLDLDLDGVINENDLCPNTKSSEKVDENGCAEYQRDDDDDGVKNGEDNCPNTPSGEKVNFSGCSQSDLEEINFNPNLSYGSVTDVDGNLYKTIKIGNQEWMAENLETTKYNNGNPISGVDGSSSDFFGILYTGYDVFVDDNICPSGWRIATYDDFNKLEEYLGSNVIDQILEAGTIHWGLDNTSLNSSGLTLLPNPTGWSHFWVKSALSDEYAHVMRASLDTYKTVLNNKTQKNCIRCIKGEQFPDEDMDGVPDYLDGCQGTSEGLAVNNRGCAISQLDSDNDGVTDDIDQCPETLRGNKVNADGCPEWISDIDNDGVVAMNDNCPNTPEGEQVDSFGCSESQIDSDNDGIMDDNDLCPYTQNGASVNSQGCAESQIDSDGDKVMDDIDECPDTPKGATVNSKGCANNQYDSDGDGVTDDIDECPDTPEGASIGSKGCADSQTDSDGDGVNDAVDRCPNTPVNTPVDADGCLDPEKVDSDGDGVSDAQDQCPDTPFGESVNMEGCSNSQMDSDEDGVTDDLDLCPNTLMNRVVNSDGCIIPTEPATNLLENSSAENGTVGWDLTGDSGIETLANGNNVFFTKSYSQVYAERTDLFQTVDISNSDNKYILIIGNLWAEKPVPNSITGHPVLWGVQNGSNVGDPGLQGQNMLHTAPAMTWQICSGIFKVLPGTNSIAIKLSQASQAQIPPDGSKAYFDSIELLIFDTEDEAIYYRDNIYKPE